MARTIQGRVAETIACEMFRELGFYVVPLGHEHLVTPMSQLEDFIAQFGMKFELKKGHEGEEAFDAVRNLPDFLITHNYYQGLNEPNNGGNV